MDQSDAAAQTVGPALGGVLVSIATAPVAIALDAVRSFVDAVLIARVRVIEQKTARVAGARLWIDIADGLRWTYGHPTLAPLALSTHVWFLANAAVGSGRTIVAARAAYPIAWASITLATTSIGAAAPSAAVVVMFVAFAVHGAAAGCENANEMSLRQTVTPDALLGRTNGTMRSANRTLAAAGAVGGGALTTVAGNGVALLAVTLVFAGAVVVAMCSPFRTDTLRPRTT